MRFVPGHCWAFKNPLQAYLKTLIICSFSLRPFAAFYKISHNSAVAGRTTKCFVPSCSSRDSASDDISGLKYGGSEAKPSA